MMLIRAGIALLAVLLLSPAGLAADVHDCDLEAAHPSDPDRVGPGQSSGAVVPERAVQACRRAVNEHPDVARFHYQLGRALVYQADAIDADVSEGVAQLEQAAARDYSQALFVLGLMYRRAGEICATEPLTRQAADQGLKAARISYVNSVLASDYDDCGVSASPEDLLGYLKGAATQVNGYYENMLLEMLERGLQKRLTPETER